MRQRVLTDGHAPAEFRADTVRNVDAWYAAFGVKPRRDAGPAARPAREGLVSLILLQAEG